MIKSLLFGVGGSKGVLHIGSLKCLLEKNIFKWDDIILFSGVSIGSIVAFFLIIGYSLDEMTEFLKHFDCCTLDCDYKLDNLLENYGLNDGEKVKVLLSTLLDNKLGVKDITFAELFEKCKKILVIQVCNLNRKFIETISYHSHPDMSVITAIRMSISVPFYFTPVLYDSCLYVDPGLLLSIPTFDPKQFEIKENECIIFQIENSLDCEEISYETFVDYSYDIFRTFYFKNEVPPDNFNLIQLKYDCESILPDSSTISILIDEGYKQTLSQYNLIQEKITST